MNKILVATRLDGATYDRLKHIAQQQDRKVGYLVRKAVERFVGSIDVEKFKECEKKGG